MRLTIGTPKMSRATLENRRVATYSPETVLATSELHNQILKDYEVETIHAGDVTLVVYYVRKT